VSQKEDINPIESLDFILNKIQSDSVMSNKFHRVRNRLASYYKKYYWDDTLIQAPQYSIFMFDVGMLTGTISYYNKNNSLTKDHIDDLNKIYKKYK